MCECSLAVQGSKQVDGGEAGETRRDAELAETESTWVKVPDLDKTQLLPVATTTTDCSFDTTYICLYAQFLNLHSRQSMHAVQL